MVWALYKKNKDTFYNTVFFLIISTCARLPLMLLFPYFTYRISLYDMGVLDLTQSFFAVVILLLFSLVITPFTRFFFLSDDTTHRITLLYNAHCLILVSIMSIGLFGIMLTQIGICAIHWKYIVGVLTVSGLYAFLGLCLAYYRLIGALKIYAFLHVAQNFLAAIGVIYFIEHGFGGWSLLISMGVSLCLVLPLTWYYIFQHSYVFNKKLFYEQTYYALPAACQAVFHAGLLYVDRVIIHTVYGTETVGLYSVLWRFAAVYQLFSHSVYDVIVPLLYQKYEDNKYVKNMISFDILPYGMLLLMSIGLISACGAVMVVPFVLERAYGQVVYWIVPFFTFFILAEIVRLIYVGFYMIHNIMLGCILSCSMIIAYTFASTLVMPLGIIYSLYAGACIIAMSIALMLFVLKRYYGVTLMQTNLFFTIGVLFIGVSVMVQWFLCNYYG